MNIASHFSYGASVHAGYGGQGKQEGEPPEMINVGSHRLEIGRKLGEGGFAIIHLVTDSRNGQSYALKRISAVTPEQNESAAFELEVMNQCKHPNILKLVDSQIVPSVRTKGANEYRLLLEYCERGCLADIIKRRGSRFFTEQEVANLFERICDAVKCLHDHDPPIQHRDLKLENVLVAGKGEYRLCDFGSCTTRAQAYLTPQERAEEEDRIQKFCTPCYRSPEMCDLYSRRVIDTKSDIWALGCLLYALVFFKHPFDGLGTLAIVGGQYTLPDSHGFDSLRYAAALIKRLLVIDPAQRPNIDSVLDMVRQWRKAVDPDAVSSSKPANSSSSRAQPHLSREVEGSFNPGPSQKSSVGAPRDENEGEAIISMAQWTDEPNWDSVRPLAPTSAPAKQNGARRNSGSSSGARASSQHHQKQQQQPANIDFSSAFGGAADFEANFSAAQFGSPSVPSSSSSSSSQAKPAQSHSVAAVDHFFSSPAPQQQQQFAPKPAQKAAPAVPAKVGGDTDIFDLFGAPASSAPAPAPARAPAPAPVAPASARQAPTQSSSSLAFDFDDFGPKTAPFASVAHKSSAPAAGSSSSSIGFDFDFSAPSPSPAKPSTSVPAARSSAPAPAPAPAPVADSFSFDMFSAAVPVEGVRSPSPATSYGSPSSDSPPPPPAQGGKFGLSGPPPVSSARRSRAAVAAQHL